MRTVLELKGGLSRLSLFDLSDALEVFGSLVRSTRRREDCFAVAFENAQPLADKVGMIGAWFCRDRGCTDYAKSIPRAKIEDAFEAMLKSLTPARQLVELATEAFRNLWNRQILKAGEAKKSITEEIRSIERKVVQLLDRIVEAESKTVVQAYETRIAELEGRKLLLREELAGCDKPIKVT